MSWRYLHRVNGIGTYLDHRLRPEVRAMLSAMTSRAPIGGVEQRYSEVVNAVAEAAREDGAGPWQRIFQLSALPTPSPEEIAVVRRSLAEEALTQDPLPAKVIEFFNKNVGDYGHSSVIELAGEPSVFIEGISWWTAWLLLDSPLVCGQEASTRAMDFSQRGMCAEAGDDAWLADLHDRWMEVFRAEVAAWKADPAISRDPQPFRPAFDRARWALPGTIATSVSTASHLRERARVIRDGAALAAESKDPRFIEVWRQIHDTYAAAVPLLAKHGLREAVAGDEAQIPRHLRLHVDETVTSRPGPKAQAQIDDIFCTASTLLEDVPTRRRRGYLDPSYNREYRVDVIIPCSLAVARDWHRHRTFYPWNLRVRLDDARRLRIHHAYTPRSDTTFDRLDFLIADTTRYIHEQIQAGNHQRARLALPLGADAVMLGTGGLRDAVYMAELREHAMGANFEYKAQAHELNSDIQRYFRNDGSAVRVALFPPEEA